jgi:hypothetical protein
MSCFADDAAVEVTTEVDQGLLAAADRFAVRHPLLRIARRQGMPAASIAASIFARKTLAIAFSLNR